jgi:biotin carboxyl carrier protein
VKYEVELEGVRKQVEVVRSGEGWQVKVAGGAPMQVSGRQVRGTRWSVAAGGRAVSGDAVLDGEQVFLLWQSAYYRGTVVDPRAHALQGADAHGRGEVVTQMPGAVVRVLVAEGQAVHKGQVLVVVEAMKMENELRAPIDGTVARVAVSAGQAVEAGALLVLLNAAT